MSRVFSKEFQVLCFIIDRTVMADKCTYEETIKKFGDKIIKHLIHNRKTIRKSNKNPLFLELTELGRREINS
jgi:hypothetical protein